MKAKTAYGTVYGIETLEEAERIIALSEAERKHESCPECRGELTLDACTDQARAEYDEISSRRDAGESSADMKARAIALIARIDAWARVQPPKHDPMADTMAIFGER
jgi:hypothetical protein